MRIVNTPEAREERLRRLADMPAEDIDLTDIPLHTGDGLAIIGMHNLPPDEYKMAIDLLRAHHARIRKTAPPETIALPPRKIRYTHADMDTTIRHCEYDLPSGKRCDAPYRVSDYPPGYYPFLDQVLPGSDVNSCPLCEIAMLKRLLEHPDDERSRMSIQRDVDLLESHHKATTQAPSN